VIAVIVFADEGGRALLRSADSAGRQPGMRELRLALPGERTIPLADSIVRRAGATAIRHGRRGIDAVNEAARLSSAGMLALLPAGVELRPRALLTVAALLQRRPECAAVASPLLVRTPDGLGSMVVPSGPLTAVALLSDPGCVPAALFVTREAWEAEGGLDERWGDLAPYEFWLRLAFAGSPIGTLDEPVVAREPADAPRLDTAAYLASLAELYAHHRARIEPLMTDVLVEREVRFGLLRERHRRLVDERDRDLAALERVRAEAAHHRAYLEHHGLAGFDWGDFRRTDPVSRDWGYDRGGPVDRTYIEAFVEAHSSDVRGAVLEIQEDDFTRMAGGTRVASSSVLDIDPANPRATVIADLRSAPELASASLDCVILTQTIHVIDDMAAVAREIHRVLRPGGVVLATLPAASRVCLEYGERGDLWRVTPAGAAAIFEADFNEAVQAESFGNVLTTVAFLEGLGAGELTAAEYAARDPYYPALTGIRARKGAVTRRARGTVLLYHRVHDGPDVYDLNVAPSRFAAHLAWLRANTSIVPLERLLEGDPEGLPDRAVALTFDDGYEDNLEIVLPLLEAQATPATFFATTQYLDQDGEYWWDALERIALAPDGRPEALRITVGAERLEFPMATAAERLAAHGALHRRLVHAAAGDRDAVMAALASWGGAQAPRYRPMREGAIRRLAQCPHAAIGAHSVSHLALPDQPAAVQAAEMLESRDRLASLTGRPVTCFAYPYGAVDRDVARLARRHFRWALSCDEGAVPESFDAARVPRLDVKDWPVEEFAARVSALGV
jgi:peptidoglycan/xylan/chitin deacetylase (PgdA/CDA1 family)